MFSYFGHCIYSAIQLSSCKCVLNKLSCQSVVTNRSNTTSKEMHGVKERVRFNVPLDTL